jgi:hypothetical protein
MRRELIALRALLALTVLLFAQPAFSSNTLEKLMMPGELSSAHAKLEADCGNCHKVLEKRAQSPLCLSCHKDVGEDVKNKSGFHGRNLVATRSDCANCHTEHLGRTANIVHLEALTFNHADSDFPLDGAHKLVLCEDCHTAGKKFSAAARTCYACHEKDQPHFGKLGIKCETCHNSTRWAKVAAFDHNATKFPLRGAHEKVSCIACHVGEVYKDLSTTCNDCHAIQDVHGGKFGVSCQDCHSVKEWKDAAFDHGKQTRFALLGAHAKAQCSDCHGASIREKISMGCFDCHRSQDVHKATLGRECGDCHGSVAWRQDVKFDHGLTDYPLVGLHAAVACESCHETAAFKGTSRSCVSCHSNDDTHLGRFAARCESCHTANGWARVSFNHDQDTKFRLTGAHTKAACYDCHKQKNVTSAELPTSCYACHQAQDVHRGAIRRRPSRQHSFVNSSLISGV